MKTAIFLTLLIIITPEFAMAYNPACEARVRSVAKTMFKINGETGNKSPVVKQLQTEAAVDPGEDAPDNQPSQWKATLKGKTYLLKADAACTIERIELSDPALVKAVNGAAGGQCQGQSVQLVNKIITLEKHDAPGNNFAISDVTLIDAPAPADPDIAGGEIWKTTAASDNGEEIYHVIQINDGSNCILGALTTPYAD